MQKAIVIDLDGTLLVINTFKHYIGFVGKLACQKGRLDIAVVLAFWVGLRKCRWVTHERMKYHILKCSEHFMDKHRLDRFVDSIMPFLNKKVYENALAYRKQHYWLCLSTAAPISYASLIAQRLSLDSVCATPMPSQTGSRMWKENVKETKCKNTLQHLNQNGLQLAALMTDHSDDTPLLKVAKEENILVNPSIKTLKMVNQNHIVYTILK